MVAEPPLRFRTDRATYFRSHTRLAAIAMGVAMAGLWLMGNPNIWTGAFLGLGAMALRGFYLAPGDLAVIWEIRNGTLHGPDGCRIPLEQIDAMRSFGSFVRLKTKNGAIHRIKYQADASATIAALSRARHAQETQQDTRP